MRHLHVTSGPLLLSSEQKRVFSSERRRRRGRGRGHPSLSSFLSSDFWLPPPCSLARMGMATGHEERRCHLVLSERQGWWPNPSPGLVWPQRCKATAAEKRNGSPLSLPPSRFLSFLSFVLCSRIMQCLSPAGPSAAVAPSFIVVKSPFVEHCVTELQLRVRFVCRQRHGGGTPFSSPPSFAGFSPGPAAVVLKPPPLPPFPSRSLRLPRREAREREGAD